MPPRDHRVIAPVTASEGFCPLCDRVAGRFVDHAPACPCGGDRVKRHIGLRTVLAERCAAAGRCPELEKPCLCQRSTDLGFCEAVGVADVPGRRAADVYVPQWGLHGPAGLRAFSAYEDHAEAYETHLQCAAQRLPFLPFVAEATGGGWGRLR